MKPNDKQKKGRLSLTAMPTTLESYTSSHTICSGQIETHGGDLLFTASALGLYTSNANSRITPIIDGETYGDLCSTNCKTAPSGASGSMIISGIPAGVHTVGLSLNPGGDGATVYLAAYNQITCTVIEL